MVHAGVPPGWTWTEVEKWSRIAEEWLRDDTRAQPILQLRRQALAHRSWATLENETARVAWFFQTVLNVRYVREGGLVEVAYKGGPQNATEGLRPWYEVRGCATPIVSGHWASLGVRLSKTESALDSGAAWKGRLTAYCPETGELNQVSCP